MPGRKRARRKLRGHQENFIGHRHFLIVFGVIAFTYQGITYTTQKKVFDFGPIQATKQEHKTIPLPPVLGAIAMIGGAVLLLAGSKNP
jgi:hypothetical protein